jgi:hypothetical protein
VTEDDLKGLRPAVAAAVRAALAAPQEDSDPEDDRKDLMELAIMLMGGASPPSMVLVAAVGAIVRLLKLGSAHRREVIEKSRRAGTAAGLAAWHASRAVGPKKR